MRLDCMVLFQYNKHALKQNERLSGLLSEQEYAGKPKICMKDEESRNKTMWDVGEQR